MRSSALNSFRRFLLSFFVIIITVCLIFPSEAHAKKLKAKIRDTFQLVTGVTLVKTVVMIPVAVAIADAVENAGIEFREKIVNTFLFPMPYIWKSVAYARENHDKYLFELARNVDSEYANNEYIEIGECRYSQFRKTLSAQCMKTVFTSGIAGDSAATGFGISELRAATDGRLLFIGFKLQQPIDSIRVATGSPVGIGMIVLEKDNINKPHLVLDCPGCVDFTPTYANPGVVMPPASGLQCTTGSCMFNNSSAKVRILGDEALVEVSLDAIGLKPGDTFAVAGLVETFSENDLGYPFVIVMNTSPFVRVKIPY